MNMNSLGQGRDKNRKRCPHRGNSRCKGHEAGAVWLKAGVTGAQKVRRRSMRGQRWQQ